VALVVLAVLALIVLPRLRSHDAAPAELDAATRGAIGEAQAHFDAARFDRALAGAEAQLARTPDAAALHYIAGAALAEMGEHRRAVEHLEIEVERSPRHLDSRLRLAVSLAELGNLEESNRTLRDALHANPGHARASFLLGRNLAGAGENDEAEPFLRQAAEGGAAGAWRELGLLRRKEGDAAGAEEALRRALAADPDDLDAMFALGQALVRAGKEAEGQRFLGRHAELESRHDRVELLRHHAYEEGADGDDLANLAQYQLLQHDVEHAVATFREALEREPGHVRSAVGLGQALLEQGNLDEAAQTLERTVAAAPGADDPAAHFFLGLARHLGRDFAGAQESLARSRQLRAWTAKEYVLLGNVLASSGALADAELAFRSSLETGPEIPEARYKLGLVLQARDRPEQARPELERFVELEPRDPRGSLLLGVVEHRLGDHTAATAAFERALDRLEVAVPDPAARAAMLGDVKSLPGAPEALATFETLRQRSAQNQPIESPTGEEGPR
jgi:tetratricopeptide (TPR) repeat protein